ARARERLRVARRSRRRVDREGRGVAREGREGRRAVMKRWLLAIALAASIGAPAAAQPRRGPSAGAATVKERIKTRIRTLRAIALNDALQLDDVLATKLFALLARYDDETDKLLEKRVDVNHRLAAADTMKDPRAIDRLIDEALANQQAFWELDARRTAE